VNNSACIFCRYISALAHSWTLKNPDEDIMSLKGAGLDAMEVYRCDRNVDGTEYSVPSRCQTQRDVAREEHNL
jgi:hypothetical protein